MPGFVAPVTHKFCALQLRPSPPRTGAARSDALVVVPREEHADQEFRLGRGTATPDADQRDCEKDIDPTQQMGCLPSAPHHASVPHSPMGDGITPCGGAQRGSSRLTTQRGHCRKPQDESFAGLTTRSTSQFGTPQLYQVKHRSRLSSLPRASAASRLKSLDAATYNKRRRSGLSLSIIVQAERYSIFWRLSRRTIPSRTDSTVIDGREAG
jgi:hypothetical protein